MKTTENIDYVLLAAGHGKRLWPITETIPKAMVRILEKPLLEWMVEAVYPNANKIIVVIGAHSEQVVKHFQESKYADKIRFGEQPEQKGTGHAVLQAEREVETEKFAVLNADTFSDPVMYELIAKQKEYFVIGKRVEDGSKYGVLQEKNGRLEKIVEKPPVAKNALIQTGTYVVPKEFFSLLKNLKLSPRGEYEVTDALTQFAMKNKFTVVPFEGYWNDVGYFWNLLDANDYALKHLLKSEIQGSVEKNVVVDGRIFVAKNAKLVGPSRIEGNVYIGENCTIGPNAFLKDCAVEMGCGIGSSEVKRSILMKGTKVPHFSHVVDCVIGENVNFGAGSQSANVRFDKKSIIVEVAGKQFETGKKKLGCVVGENTKIGCNAVIYPGKLIGSNCIIYPNKTVDKNLESNATCK